MLLTGKRDSGWEHPEARVISIAEDGDVQDSEGRWSQIRGVGDEGAILVRPDRHIAFRASECPADPRAALDAVFQQILYR